MHVPEGWKPVELVNLSINEKNSFVIGPFGSDLVQSDYRCNGVPVVFVRDVKRNRFEWVSNVYVTKEKAEKLVAHSVKSNDILITKMGLPPGIAALYPMNILPGVITADIIRLRANLSLTDPVFLCSVLNSYSVSKQVYFRTGGQTRPKLTLADYRTIKILLPPLPEQHKIAQIVSTWDKAIEKLEALIAAKQKRKKALMQQLLTGKKRFAGFEGEWKRGKLGDLVGKIYGGGTPSRNIREYWNGSIPWVTIKDLVSSKIHGAQEYINENGLKESAANIVPAGTVILATRMAVGKAVVASCDVAINQDLKAISPSENVCSTYLHYWFLLQSEQIENMGTGSTVKGIQVETIKSLLMNIPPELQEQQKIASVLTAADTEIQTHQNQLSALKEQKKGLMQQLLTGKKRVNIDEVAA